MNGEKFQAHVYHLLVAFVPFVHWIWTLGVLRGKCFSFFITVILLLPDYCIKYICVETEINEWKNLKPVLHIFSIKGLSDLNLFQNWLSFTLPCNFQVHLSS